jgi:hypothetical protein
MLLNIFLLFMCEKSIVHLIIDLNSGIQEPHGNGDRQVSESKPSNILRIYCR